MNAPFPRAAKGHGDVHGGHILRRDIHSPAAQIVFPVYLRPPEIHPPHADELHLMLARIAVRSVEGPQIPVVIESVPVVPPVAVAPVRHIVVGRRHAQRPQRIQHHKRSALACTLPDLLRLQVSRIRGIVVIKVDRVPGIDIVIDPPADLRRIRRGVGPLPHPRKLLPHRSTPPLRRLVTHLVREQIPAEILEGKVPGPRQLPRHEGILDVLSQIIRIHHLTVHHPDLRPCLLKPGHIVMPLQRKPLQQILRRPSPQAVLRRGVARKEGNRDVICCLSLLHGNAEERYDRQRQN